MTEPEEKLIAAVRKVTGLDLVEVIRCVECIHFFTGFPCGKCTITDKHVKENHYCSWAKRGKNE